MKLRLLNLGVSSLRVVALCAFASRNALGRSIGLTLFVVMLVGDTESCAGEVVGC